MENIQPGVSPCPTFTLQNCCSKSFANFIFQAAGVKNCVVLLVRCPRNCHLIIACPFTCQPHVPNTSACKNPMISCPTCTSSPSWDTNTFFCSKIWSRARFQDTCAVAFVELSICLPLTSFIPHLSIYLLLSVACFL